MSTARSTQVEVDRDRCVGSQMCIGTAGATFALDDEGQAVVVDPDGDSVEAVLDAEENCPVAAIRVRLATPRRGDDP